MLNEAGLDLGQQRDPWGTPFRASFNVERELDVLKIESAGADKQFDTDDDFVAARASWPYFRALGEKLNDVVWQYHKRTGGYIHDAPSLESEMAGVGVDLGAQRDRWGKPFAVEFGLSGTNFTVEIKSGGPDAKLETAKDSSSDDFIVWTAYADYFFEKREEMSQALANHFRLTGLFPQTEKEVRAALEKYQVTLDKSFDPWGHNYYLSISSDPRFGAPFTIQTYSSYEEAAKKGTEVSPLTQPNNLIRVRSIGADGKPGTADDFDVAALSRSQIVSLSKGQHASKGAATATILVGSSGAITGTITDPQGAVVPGATVTATSLSSSVAYTTVTDENGRFTLGNLPAGAYNVRFEAPGFQAYVVDNVPVRSSNITKLDGSLNVAAATETVEITASPGSLLNTTSSDLSSKSVRNNFRLDGVSSRQQQISTPRLREYFPETLVWQPSLETDQRGRARLDFKLADNITTWKMAVIGTTPDGEVGVAEKEIRAFQPFFVELDPPRVLTEGDEIKLPVVLRNYLDKPQAVDLEIKPETWFALSGPARKRAEVAAGESGRETFDLRAVASVRDGRQRVTAVAGDAGDAIEKPVTVHPDGEERAVTASAVLGDSTTLEMNIPRELIRTSLHSELKIYPNLLSHVAESVEGILERPYGCGEQTISSTYPDLMILRFNKSIGKDSAITAKARRYLEDGYKRLLNYRAEDGGFSYWGGREKANLALTAYALMFLNDAREFLEVDESVINGARDYLIGQQRPEGSWSVDNGSDKLALRADAVLTSYIARILSSVEAKSKDKAVTAPATSGGQKSSPVAVSITRALDYLARHLDEVNDAYMLAAYALAAEAVGDDARTRTAITRLRALAQPDEAGTVSWKTEEGTPFHGWG
ncbi:MAG TPA: alpha-2-macroglobulin family protein, partial [Pyrinomonadaceae bacterium]|nr:alpha-2-macroglobulin family protein [Pyrinomonadaceae bacterium]